MKIIAASDKATENFTDISYTNAVALVMGAEDVGIAIENKRLCDTEVKIPIIGTISSLNVSVATGIIVYEALKQRL